MEISRPRGTRARSLSRAARFEQPSACPDFFSLSEPKQGVVLIYHFSKWVKNIYIIFFFTYFCVSSTFRCARTRQEAKFRFQDPKSTEYHCRSHKNSQPKLDLGMTVRTRGVLDSDRRLNHLIGRMASIIDFSRLVW
jgi:hypothetical protein